MDQIAYIDSIDQEGRGIARVDNKVIFIDGALPGESVTYRIRRQKPTYDLAEIASIRKPSAIRVKPKCSVYGLCGGCSFQHVDASAQVALKQRMLEEQLLRIGKVIPEQMLSPIHGPYWGYRHRARLSVRYVRKKGKVLVGFREKRGSYVADMDDCHILPRKFADLLPSLARLIGSLSIAEKIPQIELLIDDRQIALVLRHMESLSEEDKEKLLKYASINCIYWFLQPSGIASIAPFPDNSAVRFLTYRLPEFNLLLNFNPSNFTQINPYINQALIHQAMRFLQPKPGQKIADFFCGLGNFTLPIAKLGAFAIGFEGSQALVEQAKENARLNGLDDWVDAFEKNLFEIESNFFDQYDQFDAALIDPPREGALELVSALPDTGFNRIVYISCHAATLARDADILVNQKGYRLKQAGLANMFPHTSHFESIALFERM